MPAPDSPARPVAAAYLMTHTRCQAAIRVAKHQNWCGNHSHACPTPRPVLLPPQPHALGHTHACQGGKSLCGTSELVRLYPHAHTPAPDTSARRVAAAAAYLPTNAHVSERRFGVRDMRTRAAVAGVRADGRGGVTGQDVADDVTPMIRSTYYSTIAPYRRGHS